MRSAVRTSSIITQMPRLNPDLPSPPLSSAETPSAADTIPSAADILRRVDTVIKASEAIARENRKVLSDALALRVDLPMDLRSCMAQLGVVMAHTRVAYMYFKGVQGAEERQRLLDSLKHWELADAPNQTGR